MQAHCSEQSKIQAGSESVTLQDKEPDYTEDSSEGQNNGKKQNRENCEEDTESLEHKTLRMRSSRSRLKERLNWFSSRSRQRLSSFGSSDNLRSMRDGLMRSRDKLSCALSPVRGRMGSYQLSEGGREGEGNISVRGGHWQ